MSRVPQQIQLHRQSARLTLRYADGTVYELPAEFLRVHSPSAEVRGHGSGQATLQTGKRQVKIRQVESMGNYAIRLVFDDGHESGIYSWEYLDELGERQEELWRLYLERLKQTGARRDPLPDGVQAINIADSSDKPA